MNSQFEVSNTPQQAQHVYQRKPGMPTWVLVLLILGLIGLSVVVLIVAAGFLFIYTATDLEVTERDKSVILEAHELAEWTGDFEPISENEEFLKQRYIDRTHDLEYTYEDDNVYLYNLHTVEKRTADAVAGYAVTVAANKFSLKSDEVELVLRNDLYSWGDRSEFYLLKFEGEFYGMLFMGRDDHRYAEVFVSGYYTEDPADLKTLFDPPLNAFETYDP